MADKPPGVMRPCALVRTLLEEAARLLHHPNRIAGPVLASQIDNFLASLKPTKKIRTRIGTCPRCKTKKVQLTFEPNPFLEEIHKISTPEWMCANCQQDCRDSI